MPDNFHQSEDVPSARHDGRVTSLVYADHSDGRRLKSQHDLTNDPHRSILQEHYGHFDRKPLFTGTVVYSSPYCNWFKVQLDGPGITVPCTMGSDSTFGPMGPRDTGVLPPYNQVVVWFPTSRVHGVILCSIPISQHSSKLTCPDYTSQGSQSGVQREDVYKQPYQSLYRDGGLQCFGSNRPIDSTILEWGKITETGLGISVDPFMTFMRANEVCGLWLHYWDSYLRLAGWNMDLQTAAHEVIARLDEGENRLITYVNTYPWETVGLYASGTQFTNTFDDKDVQFTIPKAKIDLPDGKEDVQSIARYQEHGGYLGQGFRRQVNIPAKNTGVRYYSDDPTKAPDMGVFEEFIGLDGTYGLRTAKQYFLAKTVLIPVPKEMRLPEDQKTGDDARKGNYNFSGVNEGPPHKVGDVQATGPGPQALTQAGGMYDLLTYAFNWQGLHPFYYHQQDYSLPNESDIKNKSGAPTISQDNLSFSALGDSQYMDYPVPVPVQVDARYGNVNYTQRVAYHSILNDGSQIFGDGYGAEIRMVGGKIEFTAPGGISFAPGTDFTVLAGRDINLRAHDSFDASAGTKDLRLKAEKNFQAVSNSGGMLFESKAAGFVANFAELTGEQVVTGGIMFKAQNSDVVTWAGNIYLRTGGTNLQAGQIVLDASKGNNQITLNGNTSIFSQAEFGIYIGPVDDNDNVQASTVFTSQLVIMNQNLEVGGTTYVVGDIVGNGAVEVNGPIAAVSNNEGLVASMNASDLAKAIAPVQTALKAVISEGSTAYDQVFIDWLYSSGQDGDDATIKQAAFSFRDDGKGTQYHATNYQLPESRWQMMQRLGMASGGTPWNDEPPVIYHDESQFPYPGYNNWSSNQTLLEIAQLNMYNAANGLAQDRPKPYETPQVGPLKGVTPAKGFLIIN